MSAFGPTPPQPAAPESLPPSEDSGILPRYGFRWMLAISTVAALLAFAYRQASGGSAVAQAVIVAAGFLACCFALYGVLYLVAWIPALVGRDRFQDIGQGNPFADGQLPPQILPPPEKPN